MSWAELNSGNPAWAKKEQFHVARKVEGLGKKLLQKMGWKEGMGLGKNAQGNAEPLVLDFKINREGLSSNEEGANGPSFMGRKVSRANRTDIAAQSFYRGKIKKIAKQRNVNFGDIAWLF